MHTPNIICTGDILCTQQVGYVLYESYISKFKYGFPSGEIGFSIIKRSTVIISIITQSNPEDIRFEKQKIIAQLF